MSTLQPANAALIDLEYDHGNAVGNNSVGPGQTIVIDYDFTVPSDGNTYDIHQLIFSVKSSNKVNGDLTASISQSTDGGNNFNFQDSDTIAQGDIPSSGFSDVLFTFGSVSATHDLQVQDNEVWRLVLSSTSTDGSYSVKWNGASPVTWNVSIDDNNGGGGVSGVTSTVDLTNPVPEPHEYAIMSALLLMGLGFVRRKKELVAA